MKNINEVVDSLMGMGVAGSAIKAALKKQGYPLEEIENAIPSMRRASFANEYHDWLSAAPRTMEEAVEYIRNPCNSDNVRNYERMHLNTAELAAKIWAAK